MTRHPENFLEAIACRLEAIAIKSFPICIYFDCFGLGLRLGTFQDREIALAAVHSSGAALRPTSWRKHVEVARRASQSVP